MRQLLSGDVLVRELPESQAPTKGASAVQAKVIVSGPPEKALAVIMTPEKLMREEKQVRSVQTLSQQGNAKTVAYTLSISPFLPLFHYVLHLERSTPLQVSFHRLSGSFRDFEGSWTATPLEGGQKTLLNYSLSLDPGFFAPKFLVTRAVESDLPALMRNIRNAIRQSPAP